MKKSFIFENYSFDAETMTASFVYSFDHELFFTEKVQFDGSTSSYNNDLLDKAMFLAFSIIGVSYYKLFPGVSITFEKSSLDQWQSDFLNKVYQEGLSQFAYENNLSRSDLAHFSPTTEDNRSQQSFHGDGILTLQSGGKDSLLTAEQLKRSNKEFTQFYITNGNAYPEVLNVIAQPIVVAHRHIDLMALQAARNTGGLNGHVPVTYIVQSIALIQAILLGIPNILVSIGHEGEEPHAWIDDLPVNHQWSKTWEAEQLFSEYIQRYVSSDIHIGSPLRQYSELRIAKLFIEQAWDKFGYQFSSCNRANYTQGKDNTKLTWCADCPKCANAYLLFAPFLDVGSLRQLFNGRDLFSQPSLQETFKGLLGVDGVTKPFECIGETDELRTAYHMAQMKEGMTQLGFSVPAAEYDYMQEFPSQEWAKALVSENSIQMES